MKNIFTLSNKVSRLQYTLAYISVAAIGMLFFTFLLSSISSIPSELMFNLLYFGTISILGITLLLFMNGRLNDMGKPRWYLLLAFVPLVNTIFGIALCFYPPEELPNSVNK